MNRDTNLDDGRRAIVHRIETHRAALRTAEALAWPAVLGAAVAETEARLEEAVACLAALDDATADPPPLDLLDPPDYADE